MSILKLTMTVILAALTATALRGERHCPGNVPSVSLRLVQNTLIVAPVMINGSGPYDFLVDTGAQITTVDRELAARLSLRSDGLTGVSGVASFGRTPFTHLNHIEIGTRSVEDVPAVIEDLAQLRHADANIRGILGEDYLAHFDLLIDNEHRMLCLDDSTTLALAVKGTHIALEQPYGPDHDLPYTRPLVVLARTGQDRRPLLFRLDSGSNAPVIYGTNEPAQYAVPASAQILKRVVNGAEQQFSVLRPQDVSVGNQTVHQVSFIQPMNAIGAVRAAREDGVLPTQLFQRVFVSYKNQFAILVPR